MSAVRFFYTLIRICAALLLGGFVSACAVLPSGVKRIAVEENGKTVIHPEVGTLVCLHSKGGAVVVSNFELVCTYQGDSPLEYYRGHMTRVLDFGDYDHGRLVLNVLSPTSIGEGGLEGFYWGVSGGLVSWGLDGVIGGGPAGLKLAPISWTENYGWGMHIGAIFLRLQYSDGDGPQPSAENDELTSSPAKHEDEPASVPTS